MSFDQEPHPTHNLESAIENLSGEFSNLHFNICREHVYARSYFYTEEYYEELENKYYNGAEACLSYLNTLDLQSFLEKIKDLKLEDCLEEVQEFVPKDIWKKVFEK